MSEGRECKYEPEPKSNVMWKWLTRLGIFFIALGSGSDAAFLIRDMYVEVYSVFSNDFEYAALDSINVANTVAYAENILGAPQVSRSIDEDTTANYFFSGEYLLTLFYSHDRIVAYTWISVDDSFTPSVDQANGIIKPLGDFFFADFEQPLKSFAVDDSRIVRYYLEALEGSSRQGFVDTYLGSIGYGAFAPVKSITDLYQAEVVGDLVDEQAAHIRLRQQGAPNFYGQGKISLDAIERSMLSNSEFKIYFVSK